MPRKKLSDEKREQDCRTMIRDRYMTSWNGNQDERQKAVDMERLYLNYIDEESNPYISNISLPWPYIIVESYLGKCIQTMAAMMPYVHVVEEESQFRDQAKRVEKDCNMVLYRHKWPVLSYNTYKQVFKYGTGFILETPWGTLKGQEMPILTLIDFFNLQWNPTVLDLDDKDAWIIYTTYIPQRILEKFDGNPFYKNLDKLRPWEGQIYTEDQQQIQAYRDKPSYVSDKYSKLVKVEFYWSHDDTIILTNETNVIRDDGQNFLNRIPIKVVKCIPNDNAFCGMSILEQGKFLFAEANENRNQYNDAANLMLNPQYIVDRERAQIKTRTLPAGAGKLIFTEDVNAVVPLKQDYQLLSMNMIRQNSIYGDIMNYSNAFPQFRGSSSTKRETATEFMGMKSAGELRADTYNLLLAMMGTEDLIEDIVEFKKLFMTEPSAFYYWPTRRTERAMPEDYEGSFTFKSFAGFKHMQEVERNQLIQAMTLIFGGANGAFLPYVIPKADEWLDRLLDSFPEIRSPEQLRLSPQEKQVADVQSFIQQVMGTVGNMGRTGEQKGIPMRGEKSLRTPESTPNTEMAQLFRNTVS